MSVIDDYISKLDKVEAYELQRIKMISLKIVPTATETISYGMPVLKYKGKYLLGFSAFKNHLSIFPGPEAIEHLKPLLTEFKAAKGTIQFTVYKPLPEKVIKQVVEFRVKDIDSK